MSRCVNYILREILLAQAASDSGKYHESDLMSYTSGIRGAYKTLSLGYGRKPEHQVRAIEAINKIPRCGINWNVIMEADQNGYPSVLVYFEIARGVIGNEKRLQVSFHNPIREKAVFSSFIGKGRKTRWNHEIGGSVKACRQISKYLQEVKDM